MELQGVWLFIIFLISVFVFLNIITENSRRRKMVWSFLIFIICCFLVVALWIWATLYFSYPFQTKAIKRELALDSNTLKIDLVEGRYILKFGEDLEGGKQPVSAFSVVGIIDTGSDEISFNTTFDPKGDYPFAFKHFQFRESQGQVKITINLRIEGNHTPIFVWFFPVK